MHVCIIYICIFIRVSMNWSYEMSVGCGASADKLLSDKYVDVSDIHSWCFFSAQTLYTYVYIYIYVLITNHVEREDSWMKSNMNFMQID